MFSLRKIARKGVNILEKKIIYSQKNSTVLVLGYAVLPVAFIKQQPMNVINSRHFC